MNSYDFRNVVLDEVSDPAKEKLQDGVIKVKSHELVDQFLLDLKVDKPNFTNCFPKEGSPTNGTRQICWVLILVPFKTISIWDG
jgi:hypothetical protein